MCSYKLYNGKVTTGEIHKVISFRRLRKIVILVTVTDYKGPQDQYYELLRTD